MKDYSELERLAEAATPGPWETDYNPSASPNLWIVAPSSENSSLCKFETWDLGDGRKGQLHDQDFKDAAFIAAANPQAILALTKRVKELEEALKPLLNEKAIARLKELLEVEHAMNGHRMAAIYELILNREERARLALSGKGV